MIKINQIIINAIAAIFLLFPVLVLAQTAALLPNATQQFFDNNGNPLSSGTVTTYIAGTSTLKTTWRDAAETIPNTNPIVLDAGGKAIIFGDGNYRQLVKDRNGNIIWDAVTSAFGIGSTTLVGDGNIVGTILPWSGLTAPTHYAFAYGQELSRVTYITLYNVITLANTLNCTSASPTLTGLSDTTQIPIGAPVEASCVAAGTTVLSKTASTVTVSNNATITTVAAARFFPFGQGNGTTTFNVPDLRGRILPGRSNMGGTNLSLLSSCTSPDSIGGLCGAQNNTLVTANLPPYTPVGSVAIIDPQHLHGVGIQQSGLQSPIGAGQTPMILGGTTNTLNAATGITGAFTGTAQGGVNTAFSVVQPSIMLNYIIKILSDTSTSTNVVTSIQSMTGDITCTLPVSCTGNVISAAGLGSGNVSTGSANVFTIGPQTINPVSGTYQKGLVINQTGPTTSTVGPLAYNTINVTHTGGVITTPGELQASALYINMQVGGANLAGQPAIGGYFSITEGIAGVVNEVDKIGLVGSCSIAVPDIIGGGGCYGENAVAVVNSGGSINRLVGHEADLLLKTGGSALYRYAYSAVNMGDLQGSTLDTAFFVGNIGVAGGAFKNLLTLSNSLGQAPLTTTATLFSSDTAFTVSNIFNMSNATVTGNILNFPNVSLNGNGLLSLADVRTTGGPATLVSGQGTIGASANGGLIVQGFGAVFDTTLNNSAGTNVCVNPTTTRVWNCNTLTATVSVIINGSSSGSVTQTAQAAAGTPTITWGTASGTPAATASLPLAITAATGNITCATCATATLNTAALTASNDTNVTLTLGGAPTTALLNAASVTAGWTGTLAVARGGTGDSGSAWSSFTPSLSCGTATFTVNSATSKTIGKTTFAEVDYTITAIGTCTTPITFTLPNTGASGASINGQENVNSSAATSCLIASASTTATCRKTANAAFLVNDRVIVSGTYSNQ